MGFVGNYAPDGLSPQMYGMPVILKKGRTDVRPLFLVPYHYPVGLACYADQVNPVRIRSQVDP